MLTQNEPDSLMAAHERDVVLGKKPTNGGSKDTDTNEPIVIPNNSPAALRPVTTTTDVGACPRTERNNAGVISVVTNTQ